MNERGHKGVKGDKRIMNKIKSITPQSRQRRQMSINGTMYKIN